MRSIHKQFKLSSQEKQYLAYPATLVGLLVGGVIIIEGLLENRSAADQQVYLGSGLALVAYVFLLFYLILPILQRHTWIGWLITLFNGVSIAALTLLSPLNRNLIPVLLYIIVIAVTAIIQGRLHAYLVILFITIIYSWEMPISFLSGSGHQLEALAFPLMGFVVTETVIRLEATIQSQLKRLQTINNVARSLASSLEIHQVTALVSSAIQNALDADTYYVALLKEGKLILELFYDDGEFFPTTELPMEGTLAGRVIKTQKSILLRDLPQEVRKLGIPPFVVGKPRTSQSWMGTPLEAGGHKVGMVAVASYQRKAFSNSDLELLESFAQQAAMAIVNATHHAEVELQSQLDSLTLVYNHGAFLKRLADAASTAAVSETPLSLIMLDIDYFKQYNDTYGHLVGDKILSAITQTIRSNIKVTDLVGRWGGEEFAVALPNSTIDQASQVAERIQASLASMTLTNGEGQQLPLPTVSQGIAVYPNEARDIYRLVDLSDQRLYVAKARGRNQIERFASPMDRVTQPVK